MIYQEILEQDIVSDEINSTVKHLEKNLYDITGLNFNLGNPLSYFDEEQFIGMHDDERQFSKILLSKGLLVFHEPHIEGMERTPDFYVVNQRSYTGKLPYLGKFIEITLCKKGDIDNNSNYGSRKYARKKRQRELFENLDIPIVYMYREEQESIRRFQDYIKLF